MFDDRLEHAKRLESDDQPVAVQPVGDRIVLLQDLNTIGLSRSAWRQKLHEIEQELNAGPQSQSK